MARRTLCTPLMIAAAVLVACSVALLVAVSGEQANWRCRWREYDNSGVRWA